MTGIAGTLGKSLLHGFKSAVEREREFYRRYRELSEAIEAAPDSLTHLVLRGELLLERGDYERAKADFAKARGLADAVDPAAGWGLLEQIMGDRASCGLSLAQIHPRRGA